MKVLLVLAACCFVCNAVAISGKHEGVPGDSYEDSLEISALTQDATNDTEINPVPKTGACASKPCKNNAVCFYYGSTHYVCACKTGYTGRTCQHKACKKLYIFKKKYYKECTNPYHVCVLEDKKPKCTCFDPHICRN